jgi:DNA mismatch repair protein MutS
LPLFQATDAPHPVVERLRQLDVDRLTPIDALNLLAALKRETEP